MDGQGNKGEEEQKEKQSQELKQQMEKQEFVNINELDNDKDSRSYNNNNTDKNPKNSDYYDEKGVPKYDELIQYENKIREEIEQSTPLISERLEIDYLTKEFANSEYENSIKKIVSEYQYIRTTRRDGNCFYRGFLYRLFEEIALKKNEKFYNEMLTIVKNSKELTERQGYEWLVIEDFYVNFNEELTRIYTIDKEYIVGYLEKLFANKEKSNYLIAFVRFFIAAYLKENKILYESFIYEDDFNTWISREVEPIDNECDQVQIMAIVNAFGVGVVIEYLNQNSVDKMKFPEEGTTDPFIHLLYRPGHYDILYPKNK